MRLPVIYKDLTPRMRYIVRSEYIEQQNGLCFHCKESLNGKPSKSVLRLHIKTSLFPPNFFKYPIHLHHDHDTGLTIGVVHNRCNAVLWQYYGK